MSSPRLIEIEQALAELRAALGLGSTFAGVTRAVMLLLEIEREREVERLRRGRTRQFIGDVAG